MQLKPVVLGTLVALGMAGLSAGAHAENVLRWTSQGDALTLDPHGQNEGPTSTMNKQMYEPLVRRDPKMVLEGALAHTWGPIGTDGWEFKLRKGVKFHDGADFDAEDVVFSLRRAQAEDSDFKEQVKSIKDIKVIDSHTVHLLTDGPNPILPNEITNVVGTQSKCPMHAMEMSNSPALYT